MTLRKNWNLFKTKGHLASNYLCTVLSVYLIWYHVDLTLGSSLLVVACNTCKLLKLNTNFIIKYK